MTPVLPGQTWTMLARVMSAELVTFRVASVDGRDAHCVEEGGRAFSVSVGRLRRGGRGARLVKNPDGTPYARGPRARQRGPNEWESQ